MGPVHCTGNHEPTRFRIVYGMSIMLVSAAMIGVLVVMSVLKSVLDTQLFIRVEYRLFGFLLLWILLANLLVWLTIADVFRERWGTGRPIWRVVILMFYFNLAAMIYYWIRELVTVRGRDKLSKVSVDPKCCDATAVSAPHA